MIRKDEGIPPSGCMFARCGYLRNRYLLLLDFCLAFAAYAACAWIVGGREYPAAFFGAHWSMVLAAAILFCCVIFSQGGYAVLWVYSGTKDYLTLSLSCMAASLLHLLLYTVAVNQGDEKTEFLSVVLLSACVVASRMAVRAAYRLSSERAHSGNTDEKRLLIVGAGESATIMLRDMTNNDNLNYYVVGFVDDDPHKRHARINGIYVLGDRNDIVKICRKHKVDEILISIPSAAAKDRREIIEICNETPCAVKILPSIDQAIRGGRLHQSVRKVQIEDLLERDPIKLDNKKISDYIAGKVVLVTGGGGSIGSELCRQIMKFSPTRLIVFDIYENNAYDLQMELNRKYPDHKPEVVIGSVRDKKRLEEVFNEYRPSIVFHAAAHKHVPLMEDSPGEAVKNNVFGTLNVAQCADRFGVKRFVMISTDKAVNPTNVMGATKRVCEMLVQGMQNNSKTQFAIVRFGNVLGSNGSVIPLFKKQIEQGGPVTVTDPRITRFFMTIPEAAQLVLQAAGYAKGGEIFVLDMGEPVKIYDLAKNLIRLSGYRPEIDIPIEFCGLRPGEKLYEELLMNEEGLTKTTHEKIFIGKPLEFEREELHQMLEKLRVVAESDDVEYIKCELEKVVPTYVRKAEQCGTQVG